MPENPKISIILTSYNHAKYLHESIQSILNQTYSNFELIIWDDASTDESWQIIKTYADPRIRAFRNQVNKLGGNIRRAIVEEATGEYIAVHHSDDAWEPLKLEKQIPILNENPQIGAVFTWAHIIDEAGQPFKDESNHYLRVFEQSNRSRYEWLNHFFYMGNALCHPSILIRRQCYDEVGLYRYGFAQLADFDMWVRLCLKHEIYVLPERLIRFRVRANEMSISGNRPDTRIRAHFEFLQVLYNYTKLSTFDDLKKVFPLAEKYTKVDDADLGFVLGMIMLEAKPYKFAELFGLSLLFEALNDPARSKKISELYGFNHKDFAKLTAEHDVFSVEFIGSLATQLALKEQALHDLTVQVTQRDAQLAERDAQLAERDAQLVQRDAAIKALYSSTSWRMTAPLRFLGNVLRSTKGS